MYYVELELCLKDDSVIHLGTSRTSDLSKAVSQLEAYRSVAEMFECTELVKSYELKLGTIPSSSL